jgi:hypothetical protein
VERALQEDRRRYLESNGASAHHPRGAIMHEFQDFERRRTERRDVDLEGSLGPSSTLKLINVGPRGMETESPERLIVGAEYDLEVTWEGEPVRLRGSVKWSRLDHTRMSRRGELRPVYRSGLEAASTSIPVLERMLGAVEG